MGLVMFARYGEDSPLEKGYVKSNDQVNTHIPPQSQYLEMFVILGLGVCPDACSLCADGSVLCDGCV